ncbi:MAG: hypothetical protein GY941_22185 [Planctomycetes bacterium]|nr:hypothetical protein [Planctomycetota bacterium]
MKLITIPYEQLCYLPFETEIVIDGEAGNYVGTPDDARGSLGYTLKDLTTERLKGKHIEIEPTTYNKALDWARTAWKTTHDMVSYSFS